jgi:hypothetical protein
MGACRRRDHVALRLIDRGWYDRVNLVGEEEIDCA